MAARISWELHHLYYILAKKFSWFCLCPGGLLETEVFFFYLCSLLLLLLFLSLCVRACMCVSTWYKTCVSQHICEDPRTTLGELVLSFQLCGDQILIVRLVWQLALPLNHLADSRSWVYRWWIIYSGCGMNFWCLIFFFVYGENQTQRRSTKIWKAFSLVKKYLCKLGSVIIWLPVYCIPGK